MAGACFHNSFAYQRHVQHDAVVRNCRWIADKQMLVTSGWDAQIKLWDLRSQQPAAVITRQVLGERVHAMDVAFPYLIAGTGDKKVHMFDLQRNPQQPFRSIPSPLSMQIRCISSMKHQGDVGYVIGSTEGRAAVRFCDANLDASKSKFSFKCHRMTQQGATSGDGPLVFPVHALDWYTNSQFPGCFVTAGGDGSWSVWDKNSMSRPYEKAALGLPVTAIKWSPDGSMLAYAMGNDWLKGAQQSLAAQQPTQVRLHKVTQATLVSKK
jgi:mRNA export factor